MSKVIKKQEESEVVETTGIMAMFQGDMGAGMEEADSACMAMPFLAALQALSPLVSGAETEEQQAKYRPGLFMDSITQETYKTLSIIPCAFQRRYVIWKDIESGGGYVGEERPQTMESGQVAGTYKNDKGMWCMDGHDIKDTRRHFVIYEDGDGNWRPALMSLSGTQIKKSKRFLALISGFSAVVSGKEVALPSFSQIYSLSSVKESNKKGNWYGIEFAHVNQVMSMEIYAKAKALYDNVMSAKVDIVEAYAAATVSDGEAKVSEEEAF